MLRLEARPQPSRAMSLASPLIALALTVLIAGILFVVLGKDPLRGLSMFFVEPLRTVRGLTEVALKATPLVLCALGLAVCYRANVWNIGAEGQFLLGAITAGGVALYVTTHGIAAPQWAMTPVVLTAGILGGMAWASITALLRDRFNANEILVSLMLVYVAQQLLNYLVFGPWKDPQGFNFPQTKTFVAATLLPNLVPQSRLHAGFAIMLVLVAVFWVFMFRAFRGYQLQVGGLAPDAARYAGFSAPDRAVDRAPRLRRDGGARWRDGGGGTAAPTHAARVDRLRLHRDHRLFRRPAASGRLPLRRRAAVDAPDRRRARAIAARAAARADRGVPGPAAVPPARVRHADQLSRALDRCAPSSDGGGVMNEIALLIAATIASGTPLALAGLGLLINEKAGILNLGAEGMMLVAAVAGFAAAFHSGNQWVAFAAGAGAGMILAAGFGVLVIWLNTNQYATGLALSLFGFGFSAFVGVEYVGKKLGDHVPFAVPFLADIPFLGPALFKQHPLAYVAMALAAALAWFLYRSRQGLVLRAIGESPDSAHSLGYTVRWIRLAAVVAGGALCGVAGAFLSVVYAPLWVEGLVAGRGWIALALTPFATWRPARVLLGAYLFGGVTMLQFSLQGAGVQIASQFLSMLPYIATIVVLALISRNPAWIRINMPASLGKPFHPSA